jgi:hypothetical protein
VGFSFYLSKKFPYQNLCSANLSLLFPCVIETHGNVNERLTAGEKSEQQEALQMQAWNVFPRIKNFSTQSRKGYGMLKKKKIVVLLAAAMLVSACGGGGGGDNSIATSGNLQSVDTGTGTASGSNTAPDTGGNDNTPSTTGGSTTLPNSPAPGVDQPAVPADPQMRGYLEMVGNQVIFLHKNRDVYWASLLENFEGEGLFDAARGSRDGSEPGWIRPLAFSPAAPMASFGVRVNRFVQPSTSGEATGNQTVVGRIAFDLTERSAPAGQTAEIMRLVIDGVELSTSANGELTGARVRDGGQMHIYGRNAAGVEVRETIPVPAASVRLLPVSEILDHYGDTSSIVVLVDFEQAFSQAGSRLTALENMVGDFSLGFTMSSAKLIRPAAPNYEHGPLERKDMAGPQITVDNQPAVTGAGLTGRVHLELPSQ